MIAAIDVDYSDSAGARTAAVIFADFEDSKPYAEYRIDLRHIAPYVPGEFYRRELPCILELLSQIKEKIDTVIIDGYVSLGERPGLGMHLSQAMNHSVTVIGVAKSKFEGSDPKEVIRGNSKNPLYVTSYGIDSDVAAQKIQSMHGPYRIPTLLKRVDRLSKWNAQPDSPANRSQPNRSEQDFASSSTGSVR